MEAAYTIGIAQADVAIRQWQARCAQGRTVGRFADRVSQLLAAVRKDFNLRAGAGIGGGEGGGSVVRERGERLLMLREHVLAAASRLFVQQLQVLEFGAADEVRLRHDRVILQYLALVLVPVYFIICLCVVLYGGLAVSIHSAPQWIACVVLTLAQQLLWQQPLKIWLLNVWIPGTAKCDVLALHWVLQTRAKSLLQRRRGLLFSVNALVQHFHPVCRVARLQPHLPVARLLLSLSDYDLPVAPILLRPRRRSIVYPTMQVFNTGSPLVYDRCTAMCSNAWSKWRWLYNLITLCVMSVLRLLLHGLYLLPTWLREFIVECACVGILTAFMVVMHYSSKSDPSGTFTGILVGITICGIGIAVYKAYRGILRESKTLQMMAKQERFRNSKQMPTNVTSSAGVVGSERSIKFSESKQFEIV